MKSIEKEWKPSSRVLSLLVKARKRIQDPNHYTYHSVALSADDLGVYPWDPDAVKWSVWGSIMADQSFPSQDRKEAQYVFAYCNPKCRMVEGFENGCEKHQHALRTFDAAIEQAEWELRRSRLKRKIDIEALTDIEATGSIARSRVVPHHKRAERMTYFSRNHYQEDNYDPRESRGWRDHRNGPRTTPKDGE